MEGGEESLRIERVIFFDEMTDFEFLRTFRFTKEGVRHLTTLLGNVKS